MLALVLTRVMPLHQRLGDMWAGTVVIDRNDPFQSQELVQKQLSLKEAQTKRSLSFE
jgi:hypothetical protein